MFFAWILVDEAEGFFNPGVGLLLVLQRTVLDLLVKKMFPQNVPNVGRHAHLKRRNDRAMPMCEGHRCLQLETEAALAVGRNACDDYELTEPRTKIRIEGAKPSFEDYGRTFVRIVAKAIQPFHRIGFGAPYCVADSRFASPL